MDLSHRVNSGGHGHHKPSGGTSRMCSACGAALQPVGQVSFTVPVGSTPGSYTGRHEMQKQVGPVHAFRCTACRHLDFYDLDQHLRPQHG